MTPTHNQNPAAAAYPPGQMIGRAGVENTFSARVTAAFEGLSIVIAETAQMARSLESRLVGSTPREPEPPLPSPTGPLLEQIFQTLNILRQEADDSRAVLARIANQI